MNSQRLNILLKWIFRFTISIGILCIVCVALAFTRMPFDWHRKLGSYQTELKINPGYLVLLGGGGMPSESNLIRLYYLVDYAKLFPSARVIIAHPSDAATSSAMMQYLVNNGVNPNRISLMHQGNNTREQAMNMKAIIPETSSMYIITSPENIYRSVKAFECVGYGKVGAIPAFENAMFVDLDYNFKRAGGKDFVPDVSGSSNLRYDFWNYLKLEITCFREWTAILYYYLNGWI